MSSSFSGRRALVVGATQGLGAATARMMAERGAEALVIVGRDEARGNALASELTGNGCPTTLVVADIGELDAVERIIETTDCELGSVHAVVNCAAITDRGTVWDTTPELWDHIMAVNLRAPFLLVQGCARLMKRDGVEGSIVLIGSVAAHGGAANLLPYAVSKSALKVLTRNTAYSLVRDRIRVNLLNPGWMDTPHEHEIQTTQEGRPENWLELAAAERPFGRLLDPAEVARAICFLASDESGMMTGADIDFDQSVTGVGRAPVPPVEAHS